MTNKRVRIPHEDVRLTEDEIAITQTRTFQRLFDLKQLGLAYLVYPNATHTRAVHSIRCLGEAAKIIEGLKANEHEISNDDESAVRAAALLHDIGHIPFSHTLEDEHEILPKHDRRNRLDKIIARLKRELQDSQSVLVDMAIPILYAIAEADPEKYPASWKSDLVGNTVCADLLAYITADAEATGIEKRSGHYRIYEYFTIHENRLCIQLTKKGGFRSDIVSAIIDLLDMRYSLTERVIFHHAKCVASAMMGRAAYLCKLSAADEDMLLDIGDEGFFLFLSDKSTQFQNDETRRKDGEATERLLNGLRARRLHKRVFKIGSLARATWDASRSENDFCKRWRSPAGVEQLLSSVEDEHELPRGALSLWCPPKKSGTKLVLANIVWEETTGMHDPIKLRDIGDIGDHFARVAQRIKAIEEQYLDLWTFWVAVDRSFLKQTPEIVRTLENKIGIDCDALFRESHLSKEFPEFKARSENLAKVERRLQSFHSSILQSIEQTRALSGDNAVDDAVIDEALASELKQRPVSPRKKTRDTPRLPGMDEEEDSAE